MKTVAMVATTTTCESPEELAARLAMLLDAGWQARLLCKGESWRASEELCRLRLAGHVDFIGGGTYRGQRRLERSLVRMRPDVIHFHSAGAAGKAISLRDRLGCGVVVSFRSDSADLQPPPPAALWQLGDLFLFEDEAVLERAVGRGCPRERAEVLAWPATGTTAADAGAGAGGAPLRLLAAGPLIWERGLEHAVHAVRLALDRGIRCRLRVLGGGEHLAAVGFARHQLGLGDEVELVTEDCGGSLIRALERADVLVDPAVTDTTSPAPLMAAQALGVPYVATARGCLAQGAGLVVPRRDPGAIADALAELAADSELRARMGTAGRQAGEALASRAANEDLDRLQALYLGTVERRAG